jgi:hypothetical protein
MQIKGNSQKIKSLYLFLRKEDRGSFKWAQRDLNPRPIDYESTALTAELWALHRLKNVYLPLGLIKYRYQK